MGLVKSAGEILAAVERSGVPAPEPVWEPEPDDDLLSPGQAARIVGVSVDALRRWADAGVVGFVRIGGVGWRRYWRSDVEALREKFAKVHTT